jgi:uncharacterized membrane protein YvlD (DUF360 family)
VAEAKVMMHFLRYLAVSWVKPSMWPLTVPVAVVTLGLAWFGVSMLMLWLTSVLVSGFDISGFWTFVWSTVAVWGRRRGHRTRRVRPAPGPAVRAAAAA